MADSRWLNSDNRAHRSGINTMGEVRQDGLNACKRQEVKNSFAKAGSGFGGRCAHGGFETRDSVLRLQFVNCAGSPGLHMEYRGLFVGEGGLEAVLVSLRPLLTQPRQATAATVASGMDSIATRSKTSSSVASSAHSLSRVATRALCAACWRVALGTAMHRRRERASRMPM